MLADDPIKIITELFSNKYKPVFIVDNISDLSSSLFNKFKNFQFFVMTTGHEHYTAVKKLILEMNGQIIDVLSAVFSPEPSYIKPAEPNKNWFPIFRYNILFFFKLLE